MINRGYLSQEERGIEACDYFETFLFDLCKDLLGTGRQDVHWGKFVKIRDDFIKFLQVINSLPQEKWEKQAELLEAEKARKEQEYFSEVLSRVEGTVSNSPSEEKKDMSGDIARTFTAGLPLTGASQDGGNTLETEYNSNQSVASPGTDFSKGKSTFFQREAYPSSLSHDKSSGYHEVQGHKNTQQNQTTAMSPFREGT
jgi:hypothetical protein